MSNQVWKILQKPDTVVVFDVDGTLFSYNYGTYHAYHDLDDGRAVIDFDFYKDAKSIPVIREYVDRHGIYQCYCLSQETHGLEECKSNAIERLYRIPRDRHIYTKKPADKVVELKKIRSAISKNRYIVFVDDKDDTLGIARDYFKTDPSVCTAHVTIFFEEHENE